MQNPPFQLFDQIIGQLGTGCLFVEIGSDRGSGSSYHMANLARTTGNDFITIDIDPVYLGSQVKTATMTGEAWTKNVLPTLGVKVSIGLLDGFDWTFYPTSVRAGVAGPDVYNLITEYASRGYVLNNINSAMAHTQQVLNMLPFLNETCAIMFCDTWFNYALDTFEGKGAGAAYLLMAEGFNVVSASPDTKYVLMGRNVRGDGMPTLNFDRLNQVYTGPAKRADTIMYDNI
jgi:hypothetical protein